MNECRQAISAAKNVTLMGTKVYTIAYGATASGCTTDKSGTQGGIAPCQTMQQMASDSCQLLCRSRIRSFMRENRRVPAYDLQRNRVELFERKAHSELPWQLTYPLDDSGFYRTAEALASAVFSVLVPGLCSDRLAASR